MRRVEARLTYDEYRSACEASHGTVRRYLAGCRCVRCDTLGNSRFLQQLPPHSTYRRAT